MDIMKQAVARVSKPFLNGVGGLLGHDFTAEERLELCGELEAFMELTVLLIKAIPLGDREDHEVIEEALGVTSPALAKTILETAGDSRDASDEELARHIRVFFTFASMTLMALERGKKLKEE